jgi:hypothetical protein
MTADHKPESDKNALHHVQDATRKAIERNRTCGSAEAVVTNVRRDPNPHAPRELHTEHQRLGLSTINDIREAFAAKAHERGVKG